MQVLPHLKTPPAATYCNRGRTNNYHSTSRFIHERLDKIFMLLEMLLSPRVKACFMMFRAYFLVHKSPSLPPRKHTTALSLSPHIY